MTDRARKLLDEALALPEGERADLAARLLASLADEPADELDPRWVAELERRAREAHADPSGGTPWEELRDGLLADLRRG
ncbi:MAG: addiction module protein [Kofleriaceae bacterium]|nr:addiction module protein [Myxococcales bacterium]MCB9564051.1 addiction module protein [Kofleriaceae bacterium]MCB9572435.1 addiction module protein [Kofleriaceae bacterium]